MRVILNKIQSVMLAVIVLVTTSGFTVFEHHCNTKRTTEYSLLIPDFECDHTAHAHVDKLISCCEIKPIKHEGEKCGESDCCDTYSFVVKLDITIDNQKISKNASFDVHAGLLENDTEINYTDSEEKHIIISNDLPPPLSGKDLHIYLNQLNIPCLSV